MNEHIENKLRGWSSIIIIIGWILAALLFILAFFALAAGEEESFPLFLIIIGIAADILMLRYFIARLASAFADITQNTREATLELRQLNINIQKAFLSNIQATERTIAEETRLEKERAEKRRKEAERIEAEKKQEAIRRKEAYWQEHSKEKDMLLAKREEAQKAIRSTGKLPAKEKAQLEELIQKIDAELNRER